MSKIPKITVQIDRRQGPISEFFAKEFWELAILKNPGFFSWPFWKKKSKIFFFASFPWKSVKVSWVARMHRNFDDYSVSSPKQKLRKLMQHSVNSKRTLFDIISQVNMSTAVAKSQYHIVLISTEPYILFSTTYARTMGRKLYSNICKMEKIAWIEFHHLQWKFKLWEGKFAWGVKTNHCWALSTNV